MKTPPTNKSGSKARLAVILAHPRSGSRLLCESLSFHPQITSFGEIFGEDGVWYGFDQPKQTVSLEDRNRDPIGFLDDLVEGCTTPVLVFKLLSLQQPTVWSYLVESGVPIVQHSRENVLRAYLSNTIAMALKSWRVSCPSAEQPPSVVFSRKDFEWFETHFYRPVRELGRARASVFSSSYEQMHEATYWEKLYRFLQVPVRGFSVQSRKRGTDPLWESVRNYDEMAAYLTETGRMELLEVPDLPEFQGYRQTEKNG